MGRIEVVRAGGFRIGEPARRLAPIEANIEIDVDRVPLGTLLATPR